MAADTPAYSSLFTCIHDEPEPIGHIGRGTHYSIFRAVEWHDVMRRPLPIAQVHDFAVIWDEDHDTRVIEAVEKLYIKSLLSPVQFIGERKGSLNIVVASKFYFGSEESSLKEYIAAVSDTASPIDGDDWGINIGTFDRSEIEHQTNISHIIQDSDHRATTYLRNIDAMWMLGTRDYNWRNYSDDSLQDTSSLFASIADVG